MKVEIIDKNDIKLFLEIINKEISIKLFDRDRHISFLGDVENINFLISMLKRMLNKIKKNKYECD